MIDCPPSLGAPLARGVIRARPEHFQVEEVLGFEPDEGGEHLWLWLEKRGWNTQDVVDWLARAAQVHRRAIGVSGMKDRHAQTWQWFSVHLPGKEDPVFDDVPEGIQILRQHRHRRKLNRGTHRSNRFRLTVTQLKGEPAELDKRLSQVREQGVPNYVGVQRFGREAKNVTRAVAWLCEGGEAPRKAATRSMWLSALRSNLFNRVLAERVRQGCWNTVVSGDILQPVGSRGLFFADEDPASEQRVAAGEVNPTAPLPGCDGMQPGGDSLALEQRALVGCEPWIEGLKRFGVEAARRATRLLIDDLQWQWSEQELELSFALPTGAFATTVLAELIDIDEERHVVAG